MSEIESKKSDHVCDECGAIYASKNGLKNHIKSVHINSKDHVCQICGYATIYMSRLKNHEREVHQKLKDFICKECGTAFAQNSGLQTHINREFIKEQKMFDVKDVGNHSTIMQN